MRSICVSIAVTLSVIFVGRAECSILSSHLTLDGTVDVLDDESRAALVDPDANGLDIGDTLFGFVRVSNINGTGLGNTENVVLAFSSRVTAGPGAPTDGLYSLGPVPDGDAYSLRVLLGDGAGSEFSFESLPASTLDKAIFAVIESATTNPLTAAAFLAATAVNQMALFDPDNGWVYDALGGFESPNPFGDADFFEGLIDFGTITGGPEAGGFTILDNAFAPGASFLPIASVHTDNSTVTDHEVTLNFGSSTITTNKTGSNIAAWNFTDNSQFSVAVQAIPEPGSLILWGGLACVCGLVVGFCRRKDRK